VRGRAVAGAVAGLAALALSAACAPSQEAPEQTWPQSYGATTCREWRAEMTDAQRWTAAAQMLLYAQRTEGARSFPPHSQVQAYLTEISHACAERPGVVTDVAYGVYFIDRNRYGIDLRRAGVGMRSRSS
jgi:hypothetical protein